MSNLYRAQLALGQPDSRIRSNPAPRRHPDAQIMADASPQPHPAFARADGGGGWALLAVERLVGAAVKHGRPPLSRGPSGALGVRSVRRNG